MQQQFVANERQAKLRLDGELTLGHVGQFGGIELQGVLAALLGQVHRRIGMLEQCGGILAIGGEHANADAAGDVEDAAV